MQQRPDRLMRPLALLLITAVFLSQWSTVVSAAPSGHAEKAPPKAIEDKDSKLDPPTQITIIADAFSIQFSCTHDDKRWCPMSAHAIKRAARRVNSEIRLDRTVRVDLRMFPESGDDPMTTPDRDACVMTKTSLGTARPALMVPVRHADGRVYQYPTALLKQLHRLPGVLEIKWPADAIDIKGHFSSTHQWYLGGSDAAQPGPHEIDLERIVTHLLVRGLGFGQSSIIADPYGHKYVFPRPRAHKHLDKMDSAVKTQRMYDQDLGMRGWAAPTIWDHSMYLNDHSLLIHLDQFNACFADVDTKFYRRVLAGKKLPDGHLQMPTDSNPVKDQFRFQIMNDQCTRTVAEQLYRAVTQEGKLEFRSGPSGLSDTWLAMTTHSSPFRVGISGVQIARSDANTQEFIMAYKVKPGSGKTLDQEIRERGAPESGIGPRTRAALLAMGYCAKSDTECSATKRGATIDRVEQINKVLAKQDD